MDSTDQPSAEPVTAGETDAMGETVMAMDPVASADADAMGVVVD